MDNFFIFLIINNLENLIWWTHQDFDFHQSFIIKNLLKLPHQKRGTWVEISKKHFAQFFSRAREKYGLEVKLNVSKNLSGISNFNIFSLLFDPIHIFDQINQAT